MCTGVRAPEAMRRRVLVQWMGAVWVGVVHSAPEEEVDPRLGGVAALR